MPRKSNSSSKAKPKAPGLESREAVWEESQRMSTIKYRALVSEAEQTQALLKELAPIAKKAGFDLKAITARRAAAFKKLVADLKPFLTEPEGGKK